MKYDEHFRNKLYGGVIGKYIGVMHGAEIESWTYEQIKDVFGEIKCILSVLIISAVMMI